MTKTFKRKKAVTLPVLKMTIGTPRFLQFLGEVEEKKTTEKVEGKVQESTIDLVHAVDLETGEEGVLVVGTTLKSNLSEAYEKINSLKFEITKLAKKDGKRYHTYSVYEVE